MAACSRSAACWRARRRARRARAFADAGHGIFGADRVLHRHRDRRHGLDPRRADRSAVDRLDPLVRFAGISAVHRRPDVPVHGRSCWWRGRPACSARRSHDRAAGRAGRQRARRAAHRDDLAAHALPRRSDRAGGVHRAGHSAAVVRQQGAARLRDPLFGVRSVRDLAQSAGRLFRHDLVRARHVLRSRRLRLRPHDAAHGCLDSGRVRRDASDHGGRRGRHRRDLRAAEGDLFRLRHAGVPDADPFDDPVLGVADRRRSGLARRHPAPRLPRHRPVEPSSISMS